MLRVITTLLKRTDRRRWADPLSLYASWEPRTKKVAALVPNNSRVIEFGAGKRILERYLDPSCTYVPSDVVDRGPGTIVCDLNQRPLPDLRSNNYDVAVLGGVLEYVRDVPSLLDWLTKLVTVCVLTYAPAKSSGYSPRALLETIGRLRHGWMNRYCEEELRSLFRERGFELVQEEDWEEQRLFVFSRRSSTT
jgi:Methyltransferase domain